MNIIYRITSALYFRLALFIEGGGGGGAGSQSPPSIYYYYLNKHMKTKHKTEKQSNEPETLRVEVIL